MTTPFPQPAHPQPTLPPPQPAALPAARRVLTMDDLPGEFEDEEGLPNEFHLFSAMLLLETFRPPTVPPDQAFCAVDMYLHFLHRGVARGLRPDWMGFVGVSRLYRGERMRLSYVVEDEGGRVPLVVVEALSPGTRRNDLGRGAWAENATRVSKWDVYESVLKIPYYVTIDPVWERVRWFRHDGKRYVEERPARERLWMPEAGLALGTWRGEYEGREGLWLRFYDAQGALIPTRAEREAQERDAKERERQAKEAALQQVEQELQAKEQERQAKERERRAKEAALRQAEQERKARERERAAKERERRAKQAALRQAAQEREAKEREREVKEAALQELARLKAQLRALKHAEDEE